MKLPGPDHPITITANPNGSVSPPMRRDRRHHHALTLKEALPAVQYVPREDAKMALLARTDRVTTAPIRGCELFQHHGRRKTIENSIWTYETPFGDGGNLRPSGVLPGQGEDRGVG